VTAQVQPTIAHRELTGERLQGIGDPVLERVYRGRGVHDVQELERGLSALITPRNLPDVELAASRLADAIMRDERVMIVGDFDADGATSVALCVLAMRAMGASMVDFIVPNRFEYGYGLSPEIVELALEFDPKVIVTVDNGVASIDGVAAANSVGVDVIVTDHHLPGAERPEALAIVNPNLPEASFGSPAMAGVGVAYYVLGQLRAELRERGWFGDARPEPNLAQFLDLVALGTVADVVPLDRNNRVLVYQGLQRMRHGICRPGIKALAEVASRRLAAMTAQDLGFAIGPRLNAAGRLEDMAIGIKCLLAEDPTQARNLASALDELNNARRALEADMTSDAEILLAEHEVDASRVGLTVYHERFHQGVVGILAGRLREKFHKPVIAFADAGDQAPDELKGSARSIQGLHIRDVLDHVATSHPGLLLKFGGHAMAAGMTIKRVHLERFQTIFDKAVRLHVTDDQLQARLLTDGELAAEELNLSTVAAIEAGGPWGNGFPEPAFNGDFELISQRVVGEQHLKLVVKSAGKLVDAIAFRHPPLPGQPSRVRLVYRPQANDYGELPTLQLVVEYVQPLP
jgi:single-stranded-DNA-specific exonuclease